MRRDGIADIANQIQPALGTSTSRDALNMIATDMAKFYASDVIYKSYTATAIAAALHSAGISVGGASGQSLESGQFLPDLSVAHPDHAGFERSMSREPLAGGQARARRPRPLA